MNEENLSIKQESDEQPPVEAQQKVPRRPWKSLILGLCIVGVGLGLLHNISVQESKAFDEAPWVNTLILTKDTTRFLNDDNIPVSIRFAERTTRLDGDLGMELLGELLQWDRFNDYIRLGAAELVVALELDPDELTPLLASGRLPVPGRPEVLAGDLARSESFAIDGVEFQVVGHLKKSVNGFLFTYMLPYPEGYEEIFSKERGAISGLLLKDGELLAKEGRLPEFLTYKGNTEETTVTEPDEVVPLAVPNILGGFIRSDAKTVYVSFLAMCLIALGGALLQFSGLHFMRRSRQSVIFAPLAEAVLKRPKLFWGSHIFFYGAFFIAVWVAIQSPIRAFRFEQYTETVFQIGGLGHIGAAYSSGKISYAAWMTFYNNYIEQVLFLIFLISLFPLPLGLIKTFLSLCLAGWTMSPLWLRTAEMLFFHSLTIVMELEAYIFACIVIIIWTILLWSGIKNRCFLKSLKQGLLLLFVAALFTGVLLGIAAVYEAVTLIHVI